ncbi:hypothetical protein C8F04DRAFT_1154897 [Mycena alexandri]|uniref:Uncharacterized protein n=1 Tax=Mycena alexandri TaxID=1745969 RepID=A0AAD6WM61_9AGAR|nr:hypothetical protein C8F04DRAFT_1154897 [Mycena alexandri]
MYGMSSLARARTFIDDDQVPWASSRSSPGDVGVGAGGVGVASDAEDARTDDPPTQLNSMTTAWMDPANTPFDFTALGVDDQLLHHPTQCFADMCWAAAVYDFSQASPNQKHHDLNLHPELESTSPALVGERSPDYYYDDQHEREHDDYNDARYDEEDEEGENDYGGVQAAVLAAAAFNKPSRFSQRPISTVVWATQVPPSSLPTLLASAPPPRTPPPTAAAPEPFFDELNVSAALKRLAEEPFSLNDFDDFDAKLNWKPDDRPPYSSAYNNRNAPYTHSTRTASNSNSLLSSNAYTPTLYTQTHNPSNSYAYGSYMTLYAPFTPADPSESIGFFPTRPDLKGSSGSGRRQRASSLPGRVFRYFSFRSGRVGVRS